MEAQEKILRVVEYSVFERVGSSEQVEVDVRIIGATNADLPDLVEQGKFKRDLLDRLSFEVLFLPPLRVREEDITLLARHFAGRMSYELGRGQVPEFSAEALKALEEYHWPGNIRELKNVVERAVYTTETDRISHIIFNPFVAPFQHDNRGVNQDAVAIEKETHHYDEVSRKDLPLREAVKQLEISMMKRALMESRYNQKTAATKLGLSYDQLRGLLRKYGQENF